MSIVCLWPELLPAYIKDAWNKLLTESILNLEDEYVDALIVGWQQVYRPFRIVHDKFYVATSENFEVAAVKE